MEEAVPSLLPFTMLDREDLTYQHLYRAAIRLTSKSDIRRLGLKLGVKDHMIDTIFHNKRDDITEAAYETLKEWRKAQEDAKAARITLWKALTHPDVNLHQVAREALHNNCIEKAADIYADMILWQANQNGCRPEDTPVYKKLPSGNAESLRDRALSDDTLQVLSRRLSKDDMKCLAPELNISAQEVNTSFANHCNDFAGVTAANYDILKSWRNKQNSREEAYFLMGEALIRAGLKLIASEVLNYPTSFSLYLRALTDDMLEQLSERLTKTDMKRLASKLNISSQELVNAYVNQSTDSTTVKVANYNILRRWLNKQNSREEAYIKLGEALIHPDVELNLIAKEVLDYCPATNPDEQIKRSGVKRKMISNNGHNACKKMKTMKSMDQVHVQNGQNHKVRIVPEDAFPGQINGMKSRMKRRKRNRRRNKQKKLN